MSELNSVRMSNFVKRNRDTITQISRAVSQLSLHAPEALRQIVYVTKNPDAIADMPTYAAATSTETAALITAFREMQAIVDAYEQVRDNPADVDAIQAANNVDISTMSMDLVKG